MEFLMQAFIAAFSPQIAIALVGGLFGGLIGAENRKKEYGKRLTFLLLAASIIDAGAVADWLTSEHQVKSLFISMAGGLAVGIFSGHLMDALRIASPRLASKVVNKAGNTAVDKIDDIGNLIGSKSHTKKQKETSNE